MKNPTKIKDNSNIGLQCIGMTRVCIKMWLAIIYDACLKSSGFNNFQT